MKRLMFAPQLKVADMFSMLGMVLVGLGIGAYFHEHLVSVLAVLVLIGLIFHAVGMFGKYSIEHERINPPVWIVGSFLLATIGLMICGFYILIAEYSRFVVT